MDGSRYTFSSADAAIPDFDNIKALSKLSHISYFGNGNDVHVKKPMSAKERLVQETHQRESNKQTYNFN